jgi:hypothetical protein
MSKHIDALDPKKELADKVNFDGASNMQKAGEALERLYPFITCEHGAEHVLQFFGEHCQDRIWLSLCQSLQTILQVVWWEAPCCLQHIHVKVQGHNREPVC